MQSAVFRNMPRANRIFMPSPRRGGRKKKKKRFFTECYKVMKDKIHRMGIINGFSVESKLIYFGGIVKRSLLKPCPLKN